MGKDPAEWSSHVPPAEVTRPCGPCDIEESATALEESGGIDVDLQIHACCLRLASALRRALAPDDIGSTEYFTLLSLYGRSTNRANPSELCRDTLETPSNMTRVCDRLIERGFMHRVFSTQDRRRVDLSLTESGARFIEHCILEARTRAFGNSTKRLTTDDMAVLLRLLETVARGSATRMASEPMSCAMRSEGLSVLYR